MPDGVLRLAFALAFGAASPAIAADFMVVGDAIPSPLNAAKGDAERGRTLVASRQESLCLLCHGGSFAKERFQGTIAPSLDAIGARLSEGQIRLRIVDPARLNPASIMPAYFRSQGLERVAPAFRGKPILDAQQIEDIVAYLASLK